MNPEKLQTQHLQTRLINMYISGLRQRIEDSPSLFMTLSGNSVNARKQVKRTCQNVSGISATSSTGNNSAKCIKNTIQKSNKIEQETHTVGGEKENLPQEYPQSNELSEQSSYSYYQYNTSYILTSVFKVNASCYLLDNTGIAGETV